MTRQHSGLILTFIGVLLWAGFFLIEVLTPADEGVPIGAALIYLLGIVVSVGATATALAMPRPGKRNTKMAGGGLRSPSRAAGTILGVLSLILWPLLFVSGSLDLFGRTELNVLLISALVCFVSSSALLLINRGNGSA